MTSFGLDCGLDSPRHTFNQILTHLWVYVVPYFCHSIPNLPHSFGLSWILGKPLFGVISEVLNGTEIWRLWRPIQDIDSIVFHPPLGLFGGVFKVIVLLEDNIL